MYLKSLEIQGFKSFPDKISLTFDKGLTAVVGPNGSGKSNIGDSVRWVLGEQSTKTLRGNKMEDVIFSGTVTRKAMGFASVTLNIDNSDKTLSAYDETLSITRKLFRSGESEYRINGKSVRLKDVNELFMDTGLGRDGYSIIGQGRIAEIVGAKSTERRDIFEEAAGISKFRYKKYESERKLSDAQENIVRLGDIISELENRVEPLKIQSEKAQRFIKLSEDKKKLEISVWIYQLEQLKLKIDDFNNKILVAQSEYNNIENDILKEEAKIQIGYRKMQESGVKADELRLKMVEDEQLSSGIKSDIAVYENDIKHSQENIKNLVNKEIQHNVNKNDIKIDIEKSIDMANKIELDLKTVRQNIDKVSNEFKKIEVQKKNIDTKFDKADVNINAQYIKQSEIRFNIESAEIGIDESNRLSLEFEKSMLEHNEKSNQYKQKFNDISIKLDKNKADICTLKNKIADCEKLYNSKSENFESSKIEFEKILFQLKEKQQRNKILKELENNMEGFSGSVKKVLKASKKGKLDGVEGTVSQLIKLDEKYAVAIETALGGALQNIVVKNEKTAKKCIEFLKEEKAGRATFLPLTTINGKVLKDNSLKEFDGFVSVASKIAEFDEKYRCIIEGLLGKIAITNNLDCGTEIAKVNDYNFKIVTIDGQIINSGGSFTGGSIQRSAGVFSRKNEILKLNSEIEKLCKNRDELNDKVQNLRDETEKLRLELKSFNKNLLDLKSENIILKNELSQSEEFIKNSRKIIEDINKRQQENDIKLNQNQQRKIDFNLELEKITVEISEMESQIQEKQNIQIELKEKRIKFSEKLSNLKIKEMEMLKNLELQKRETDVLKRTQQDLLENSQKMTDEILEQKKIIAEKEILISECKQKFNQIKQNYDNYELDIKKWQSIQNEQRKYIKDVQDGLKAINSAKEKLTGELMRFEERRNVSQLNYDKIISDLFEVYELTRSEAIKIAEKLEDIETTKRLLNDVKNKIRSLGSVNIDAVEEYKEVSERYKFMSQQLKDVISSKKDLEKIIFDLTQDMCKIFSESFEIINANFKEIFSELFGGGSANLVLTEPECVLESGIEINVAPPGKVIKSLISLSGGEQSFVAIAIYFAILKLRPSPFCILDEIDAALDESNVARYAQYLKKFIDTTQFVLVTHRRSAMEEANVLYGVTMQEDGISKLLKMEQVDI